MVLTIFASCSDDVNDFDVAVNEITSDSVCVQFEYVPYVFEGALDTRASFGDCYDDEDPFDFYFTKGDRFGICCLDDRSVNIPLCSINEVFDSGTSKLKNQFKFDNNVRSKMERGKKYVLYYPYFEDYHASLIYCYYDNQFESTFAGKDYVGKKNFYFSDVFVYDGKNLPSKLSLHSYSSVICLYVENLEGRYSTIELVNAEGKDVFYKYVVYDCYNTFGEYVNLASEKVDSLPLNLSSLLLNGDEHYFYLTSYPVTTGEFYIKVTKTNGEELYSTVLFPSIEMKSGYGYNVECTEWTTDCPSL